jgi:ribonuclease E
MPNTAKGGGISRKIFNSDDRKKIREILQEIDIPKSMGLIVRTAGANKTKNEINKDLSQTITTWDEIKNKAVNSIAPALIYEEGDIIKRALRDIYDNETTSIIIEGNEGYQKAKNFMKNLIPKNTKFIKKYRGNIPLFHKVGIEKNLNKIFEPTIELPSGGYMVINPTEALISIDINSGKSTKEKNIERTALTTNLEAADEISRQIKIRDLSGLIVIDFIDMINFYNRRMVEKRLKEKLKHDRAKIQFSRISNFGLLEMSRQTLGSSSVKWNLILSLESFSLKIIKIVEELAFSNKVKIINVAISEKVKNYIEDSLEKELTYFKNKYKFVINFVANNNLIIPEYSIELLNKNKKLVKKIEYIEKIEKQIPEKKIFKPNFRYSKNNKNRYNKNKNFHKKKHYNYGKKVNKNNFSTRKPISQV